LAREPSGQESGPRRETFETANVGFEPNAGEASAKYLLRPWVVLAEEEGSVAGPMQTELDAADAGKETYDLEFSLWSGSRARTFAHPGEQGLGASPAPGSAALPRRT
jgi:hypothetical protein